MSTLDMMYSVMASALLFGIALASLVWCVQFAFRWRRHRAQYKNLPCPPHSFWWGHLQIMGEMMAELQPDTHPQVAWTMMAERYDLGHVFYVDLWPIIQPFVMIHDPAVAAQITQTTNLPKHPMSSEFLGNMTGEHSIVHADGAEWKFLRTMLSPSFSPQYLVGVLPVIIKHVLVLRDRLQQTATAKEVIIMQDFATAATIDTIGEIVMGKNLDSQRRPNRLADNFHRVIDLTCSNTNPIGTARAYLPKWWYCRQLDQDIGKVIVERHENRHSDDKRIKTTVDLAFDAYQDGHLGVEKTNAGALNPHFLKIAVNNVKTILLGGHDTTATTLSYTIFFLSQHPDVLARLRAEHDHVFTSDPLAASDLMLADPKVLSATSLPLTTAVLRESLRLFPAGSTLRMSTSDFDTITYEGRVLPLSNHALLVNHYAIGRRADLWPDPLAFKPDRFLPDAPPLPKDAFRTFEKGPRQCLGQGMAMLEMKVVLVLLARDFDFTPAYAEDAKRVADEFGGQHYQMIKLGPKPAGGMPMRVVRRSTTT